MPHATATPSSALMPNPWTASLPWIDRDDADIEAYVAGLARPPKYDLAAQLRAWRDNGIVIFEGVVSTDLIDQTLADIDHFQKNFRDYKIPIEIRSRQLESSEVDAFPLGENGVKINHLHCFSRAAARLSLTPEIADFIAHIFSGPAAPAQSLTFWRGSQQPIHIDYPYVCQQKKLAHVAASWIPLEDIHPDSGPLAYYPGGHRTDVTGFFDWGGGSILLNEKSARTPSEFSHYLAGRMAAQGIEPVEFHPKRGDALIWHGNLPHEGTRVKNPELTRKSYVTHYTSLDCLPDWMRPPRALENRLGVFENGGYAFRYPWFEGRATLPSWGRS